jgi:predicted transcriptional regulator of viral defense system
MESLSLLAQPTFALQTAAFPDWTNSSCSAIMCAEPLAIPKGAHTMKHKARTAPDHDALYRAAEEQAGYFTARQAARAGFSWERLTAYSKSGRFQRVSHGIYRLAQFPSSRFEDLFVAWLKCGPKSAISHESALALYELSDVLPGEVHVTVPRTASRRRKGIRLHTNRLRPADVVKREGLPVTSVARTIADVARAGLSEDHVSRAIRDALKQGLTTKRALLAEARRRGGRAARLIRAYSNSSKGES